MGLGVGGVVVGWNVVCAVWKGVWVWNGVGIGIGVVNVMGTTAVAVIIDIAGVIVFIGDVFFDWC